MAADLHDDGRAPSWALHDLGKPKEGCAPGYTYWKKINERPISMIMAELHPGLSIDMARNEVDERADLHDDCQSSIMVIMALEEKICAL